MLWRLPCEIAFQFFHFLQRRYAMRSLRRGLLCGGIALICCCLVLGQVKADTLNAYWKFNESSGTTAANSGTGGTTLNGSLLGSESYLDGNIRQRSVISVYHWFLRGRYQRSDCRSSFCLYVFPLVQLDGHRYGTTLSARVNTQCE